MKTLIGKILVLILLCSQICFTYAKEKDTIKYHEIADKFFDNNDYYRAITYYKLALFEDVTSENKQILYSKIADSFYKAQKAESAIEYYLMAEKETADPMILANLCFKIGKLYYLKRKIGFATEKFQSCLDRFPDKIASPKLNYYLGFSNIDISEFEKAKMYFSKIDPKSQVFELSQEIKNNLNNKPFKKKNKILAGLLSIIPGAGQLYTEHYSEAIVSFVINGLFGFLIYDSFRKSQEIDNYGYTNLVIFSSLGLSFYNANIYGAAHSAKRYNQASQRKFIQSLHDINNSSEFGLELD
ncbi:MAG: hypothetical protein ABIA04_08975 [Pseudomonadota bacterium]